VSNTSDAFYPNVPIGAKLFNILISMRFGLPVILLCPVLPSRTGTITSTLGRPFSRAHSVSASLQEMIDRAAASVGDPEPYDPNRPSLANPFESPSRRDSAYPFAPGIVKPSSRQGSTSIPPDKN
jgi:hypothetical protein